MKISIRIAALLVGVMLLPALSFGQTISNTVTNSAAIDSASTPNNAPITQFAVSSTTNIQGQTAGGTLYWLFSPVSGEQMEVVAVPVAGTVRVVRGVSPTRPYPLAITSTLIILTSPLQIVYYEPQGACTRGQGLAAYSPIVDPMTSGVGVCRASVWQWTYGTLRTFNSTAPFTP